MVWIQFNGPVKQANNSESSVVNIINWIMVGCDVHYSINKITDVLLDLIKIEFMGDE